MKVLVVGKRNSILQWYEHVLAADVPGVTLTGFALNHRNEIEHLGNYIDKVFRGLTFWDTANRRLMKFLADYRPEMVVIADRFYLAGGVDETLAALGVPVCQWVGDRFEDRLFANRCVTHFFYTDSGLLAEAQRMGDARGHYLPLAVDPARFAVARPWAQRSPEPLFIGAWSENREAQLSGVRVPLAVYGKGWDRMRGTPHRIHARNISLARVAALYGAHKLVLNVINSNNIVSGLNMRCFEAPAAGACLVTDRVADLPHCYEAGREVAVYDGAQELNEVLASLQHDDQRAAGMAAQGRQRCLAEHTYARRIAAMVNIVGINAAGIQPR
ncbi:MAG: glycosyltransferase [Gammaproteobacteria bacterium]